MHSSAPQQPPARNRQGATALAVGVLVGALLPFVSGLTAPEDSGEEAARVSVEKQAPAPAPDDSRIIPTSRPLEMYVPAIGLVAGFEQESCRLVDGLIDPVSLDLACAYTAPDRPYRLPGSNADDIVVIAGHAGAGTAAVFDPMYNPNADHHNVRVGDVLYIRTETSGENWLKYTATDLHSPEKSGLAGDASVWGEGATPGRLLTISCIQPAFAPSVRNAVVGWQFAGIAGPGPGADAPPPILPAAD